MKFQDIPQFPQSYWQANIPLDGLIKHIKSWSERKGSMSRVQLNPDYQRGHVWTEDQQIAFMEYMLRGGASGRDIYFNHPGWMGSFKGSFVLVDGLQRLTAAIAFLRDEIPVFGTLRSEYEDDIRLHHSFIFHVSCLRTRAEVLQWYVDFNVGGTPHEAEEIQRVRDMIAKEQANV
jgi:hypothetical protein